MRYLEEVLANRLKWLSLFRLFISILAIGAILVLEARLSAIPKTYICSYYTLLFACLVNLFYAPFLKKGKSLSTLAVIQLVVDVMIESLLVYFTGIDKVFAYLYFSTVIASSMLLMPQASYIFASISSVMLSCVLLAYFFAAVKDFELPLVDPSVKMAMVAKLNFLLPYIFFFALSLHLVAFLSSKLAEETSRIRIFSREILQNMTDGVIGISKDGGLGYINEQAKRFLGFDSKAVISGSYKDILPEEVVKIVSLSLKDASRRDLQITIGDLPLAISLATIHSRRGFLRGVVLLMRDLSHVREAEELRTHQERFRAVVELSAGVAHEIRNPLSSIRGAAQELEKLKGDFSKGQRLVGIIKKESERLNKIVSNFLEFAVPKSYQKIWFNLDEVIMEVVQFLEEEGSKKSAHIEVNLQKNIHCRGSPVRLRQVFLNIGVNALDAIEPGGRVTILSKIIKQAGLDNIRHEWILVEITDDGVGMDEETKKNLFIPFFTTKPGGVGMGLAIAKKIVEEHEGYLLISTKKGEGTRCSVYLPAQE